MQWLLPIEPRRASSLRRRFGSAWLAELAFVLPGLRLRRGRRRAGAHEVVLREGLRRAPGARAPLVSVLHRRAGAVSP